MTTTTISETISSAFRSAFESHPARRTDPALALSSARETAAATIPAGVTGDFDDETLTFAADEPKVHWTQLIVRNAATREILTGADRIDALREFRARETMLLGTFERTGGEWEREDDQSTWGPQFADDVDWTGFDGDATYRVIVGERGNEQGHVIPCEPDASEQDARNHLQGELRAYGSDGWGRVEVQYPGETGWRRLGE